MGPRSDNRGYAGLNGSVAGVNVLNPGNYTVQPMNPVAQGSSSGTGIGATFNVTFSTVPGSNIVVTTY